VLSKAALANFATLQPDSDCDNVLLEQLLALELKERGQIKSILPILVGEPKREMGRSVTAYGDFFATGGKPRCPEGVVVASVDAKAREHLARKLGTPSGFTWREVGDSSPIGGVELKCDELSTALEQNRHFNETEWSAFGVAKLRKDHFIKSGTSYFEADWLHVTDRTPGGVIDTLCKHQGSKVEGDLEEALDCTARMIHKAVCDVSAGKVIAEAQTDKPNAKLLHSSDRSSSGQSPRPSGRPSLQPTPTLASRQGPRPATQHPRSPRRTRMLYARAQLILRMPTWSAGAWKNESWIARLGWHRRALVDEVQLSKAVGASHLERHDTEEWRLEMDDAWVGAAIRQSHLDDKHQG